MADETKQPETYEEINAAIDAAVGAKPEAAPEPEMLEVKLATGQVYKGKTKDEVIEQLKRAQEHASMTIHEKDQQLKTVMAQISQPAPAPGQTRDGFNKAQYYKLLEENPVEAADYLDSWRPKVKEAYQSVQQLRQGSELTTFLNNCQDFPATDNNAIAAMRNRLQQEGREPTADNLELVYSRLTREGVIKPVQKATQETRQSPAPVLGGMSGMPSSDALSELETMPMAELEKIYRRKGLIQ